MANQGPTDPAHLYVLVTWDRPTGNPSSYDVLRDGIQIAIVTRTGDPYAATSYRDSAVSASRVYSYQVRPRYSGGSVGPLSAAASVYVRSNADLGGGKVFRVDSQPGSSDLAKAQAAVNAAIANHGGIVQFSARTYAFSGTLQISNAHNVVLRGAGIGQTFLQPSFAGESDSCGNGAVLLNFYGSQAVSSTHFAGNVPLGARSAKVTSVSSLQIGQRFVFYEPAKSSSGSVLDFVTPKDFASAGVAENPATGRDDRKRWDANEIVGIDATTNTVTFKYPFSQSFTSAVPWAQMTTGDGNGVEEMTIQGRSSSEQTYYRLIYAKSQSRFAMADVQERWANRNYILASGYEISLVGFRGEYSDSNTSITTCRYKVSVYQSANFTFVGGQLGSPSSNNGLSLLTIQSAQRTVVRNSSFWGSRSYAFNEHGQGSRDYIFENNYVANITGDGGVALGNTQWGFSGTGVIRNNTFEKDYRDVALMENSYGVAVVNNIMRNTQDRAITGYAWGAPFTASSDYGSVRWFIANNTIMNAANGVVLGDRTGAWYPYLGVKDVIISGNSIQSSGSAVALRGDSTTTSRFQVLNNSGTNSYIHPPIGPGDYWTANADGVTTGAVTAVTWANALLPWESAIG
jgi:hypothetical protein